LTFSALAGFYLLSSVGTSQYIKMFIGSLIQNTPHQQALCSRLEAPDHSSFNQIAPKLMPQPSQLSNMNLVPGFPHKFQKSFQEKSRSYQGDFGQFFHEF
jgi:hypothetical protein